MPDQGPEVFRVTEEGYSYIYISLNKRWLVLAPLFSIALQTAKSKPVVFRWSMYSIRTILRLRQYGELSHTTGGDLTKTKSFLNTRQESSP